MGTTRWTQPLAPSPRSPIEPTPSTLSAATQPSDSGPDSCIDGVPHQCDFDCAAEFRPFFAECHSIIEQISDNIGPFELLDDQCANLPSGELLRRARDLDEKGCVLTLPHPPPATAPTPPPGTGRPVFFAGVQAGGAATAEPRSDCCRCSTIVRTLIKGSALTGSGSTARLKLASHRSNEYNLRNVVIGVRAGTYDIEPDTLAHVCFSAAGVAAGDCTGQDIAVSAGTDGLWSDYFSLGLNPQHDYIVSFWQICGPDYYVEWPVKTGNAEAMTWYQMYHTADNEDGSHGPGVPSVHARLAAEAALGIELPTVVGPAPTSGPNQAAALASIAAVQEIQVHSAGTAIGGHRRSLQMNLGGLGGSGGPAAACDFTSVQARAATIDEHCCPAAADCTDGVPNACRFDCAIYFVPFFEDCHLLLAALGSDLSSFSTACATIDSTVVTAVVEGAVCDPVLSCHSAQGPLYCVDATGAGGGATATQLEVCDSWATQGGRWQPSTNPCTDVGSLLTNGGFEAAPIAPGSYKPIYDTVYGSVSEDCADCDLPGWTLGHPADTPGPPGATLIMADNECRSPDHQIGTFPGEGGMQLCTEACAQYTPDGENDPTSCQFFLYSTDVASGACYIELTATEDCPEGWRENSYDFYRFEPAEADGAVYMITNGNGPWGGLLDADIGQQFIGLCNTRAAISQIVTGLTRGNVYEIRLLAANRPGYGDDETLVIKVDNHVVWLSTHSADRFEPYGVAFVPRASQVTLTIENDSPVGDRTIFIDNVQVIPVRLGAPLQLSNPSFDRTIVTEDTGLTGAPNGWAGAGSPVTVQNGGAPWGGLSSRDGPNFLALQGLGSAVEQQLVGLQVGTTYIVQFKMTHRPGYGEDELLHVKVDDVVIWEALHPADDFATYSALFTATRSTGMLRFENDSPEGDRSVFIDAVTVAAALNALAVVPPLSSSETQPYDFQFLLQPYDWAGAEAECVRRGRHLAAVHSVEEAAWIADLHHQEDAGEVDGVWIGFTDASCSNTIDECWSWSDESLTDWTNWAPGEPNQGVWAPGQPAAAEDCADMSARSATWVRSLDRVDNGNGFNDYQWNDNVCSELMPAVCGQGTLGSRTLLAYYSFDDSTAADRSGNHRDGVVQGGVTITPRGYSSAAAQFDGTGRIVVSAFRNWDFGPRFTASVFFQRTSNDGNYMGIVSNGYGDEGSWEIRMGRENGGRMLGGGVRTEGHDEQWDAVNLVANVNEWHHACIVYDGDDFIFYLDGVATVSTPDRGNIAVKPSDVFIGQPGDGSDHEYFIGLIDEVKLYSRALGIDEVHNIFRTTATSAGGVHVQFCPAHSAASISDLGAAHVDGSLPATPDGSPHESPAVNPACSPENALLADGLYAGLALPTNVRADGTTYAVWRGHAVTACLEIDFGVERDSTGIRYLAAGSDEVVCGDACSENGCGTVGELLVYVSDGSRASTSDFTTFELAGRHQLELDHNPGDGIAGSALWGELVWEAQPVQYVALCRGGGGPGRDNLIVDAVSLRVPVGYVDGETAPGCG